MLSCSVTSDSATLWTVAHQAPLSTEFYKVGCHFPPLLDISNPGVEPTSFVSLALQADSLPAEPSGKLLLNRLISQFKRMQAAVLCCANIPKDVLAEHHRKTLSTSCIRNYASSSCSAEFPSVWLVAKPTARSLAALFEVCLGNCKLTFELAHLKVNINEVYILKINNLCIICS